MNIFTKTLKEGKAIKCTSIPALDVVTGELAEDNIIWKDDSITRDRFQAELYEKKFTIYILKAADGDTGLVAYWSYNCPSGIKAVSYVDLLLM